VKTRSEVESRLKKLRTRYARKYMEQTQKRCHSNCVFNMEHAPNKLTYKQDLETEFEVAPRVQKTHIVIGEEKSIHLCMYGAENTSTWPGDICDDDDKARRCPMFKPLVTVEQAKIAFQETLCNDEYVFDHYRDVATLQWVLNERVHTMDYTLFERIWFWFKIKFWKSEPALPQLPSPELTSELWDEK
jgi:hypothetical protein